MSLNVDTSKSYFRVKLELRGRFYLGQQTDRQDLKDWTTEPSGLTTLTVFQQLLDWMTGPIWLTNPSGVTEWTYWTDWLDQLKWLDLQNWLTGWLTGPTLHSIELTGLMTRTWTRSWIMNWKRGKTLKSWGIVGGFGL